jgi:uncharacterized membrane protein
MPKQEPAVWIGLIGSIVLVVAQQIQSSGIITSANGVNIENLIISVVPLITGILTRQFVSPAS